MAMTPEGRVKNACKKRLKDLGVWFYMPVQNGLGTVGIPDIVACINGTFVGIECKAPGKEATVTPNQKRQLDGIRAANGVAMVVTHEADMLLELREQGLI